MMAIQYNQRFCELIKKYEEPVSLDMNILFNNSPDLVLFIKDPLT